MKDATVVTSAALRQAVGVVIHTMDEHDLDEDVAQTVAEGLERVCRRYVGARAVPARCEGRDALEFLAGQLADINDDES